MDSLPGFDPSTMTYLATQMAHPGVVLGNGSNAQYQDLLLPMDLPDHHSTYGYAGYDSIRSMSISTSTLVLMMDNVEAKISTFIRCNHNRIPHRN
jgi:hypothetical protein